MTRGSSPRDGGIVKKGHRVAASAAIAFALVIGPGSLGAQDLGGGSGVVSGVGVSAAQGFSSQTLVLELSLFLPEEIVAEALGPGPRPGSAGAAPGPAAANQGRSGTIGTPGSRRFPALDFKRDPRLYLSKSQIELLKPLLRALEVNPMPSPSKARAIQAEVDSILTGDQKKAYADWRKAMAKFREDMRNRFAANSRGSAGPSGPGAVSGAAGAEAGAASPGASAGGARGFANGGGGSSAAPSRGLNELERRQRQLTRFLALLDRYEKTLG